MALAAGTDRKLTEAWLRRNAAEKAAFSKFAVAQ
jgi:hypothetical protein